MGQRLLADPVGNGTTVGLCGTLGAGKTYFAQSLISSLGIDRNRITSPTFSIIQTYPITSNPFQWTIHHLDAYRIRDEDEFLELGVEELLEASHTIILIEWADKVKSVLPTETLWLELEWLSMAERLLTICGVDSWRERIGRTLV
jgi:tRNA threonylcarbamoyladenosine biosynthesis protein TsaE